MSADKSPTGAGRAKRTRLGPSEKYEVFVNVLSGQATQRGNTSNLGAAKK